jgi:WD40 repeat protein
VAYDDGAVRVFQLPSGRQLGHLAPDSLTQEIGVVLHPTEPLVAVWSYYGTVVQIRNFETGSMLDSLPQTNRVLSLAWHPRGHALAVGFDGHPIQLYDRTTWQVYRTLKTDQSVTTMAFNHAGDKLVCTGWQGHLELFDTGTGRELTAIPSMRSSFRFSQDDLRLASAVHDGQIGIWHVSGGPEFRSLIHNATSETVEYLRASVHDDGRLLAIAMNIGFGIWDLSTGSELAFIPGGNRNNQVLFEPSGSLLTLSTTGLARWPVATAITRQGKRDFP